MIASQNREIHALVNDIRDGKLLLPELQRSYVWKSTQVRDLFDSLYHQYPSGQILIWETEDLPFAHTVSLEDVKSDERLPLLLLDGQQRLTSLAAIMLGKPLVVRNSKHPIDIAFNIYTERFEVAGPRQSGDAGWISLTRLYTQGVFTILSDLKLSSGSPDSKMIFERLQRLENIKAYLYQVNILSKMSYEEVTHIFVRINSGGTKLGTADLALAQMSSRWRGVTDEFSTLQAKYEKKNKILFTTGILVRLIAALVSGQTRPAYLFRGERQKITVVELSDAWNRLKASLELAVSFLVSNCEIDRLDLLPTQYIFIPLVAYFDKFRNQITEKQARELQRWVYLAIIWMRYSGAAETAADQDIAAVNSNQPISSLVQNIDDKVGRGRLVTEREFRDQRKNSPFMLISYILAKRANAQDWFNGLLIDGSESLEFHHIFPKEVLREKYDLKAESHTVDQVANLAFLSKRASIKIHSQTPSEYLPSLPEHRLKAQYVPMEPDYWKLENFEKFLVKRREKLADAVNSLLNSLTDEPVLYPLSGPKLIETRIDGIERQLRELVAKKLFSFRGEQALELIPKEVLRSMQVKSEKRLENHPYLVDKIHTLEGILEFCMFSDYAKIVTANWPLFVEIFGNPDNFSEHIGRVTIARNALKHNNEIPKSDLALAEAGILWIEECLEYAALLEEEAEESEDIEESINNESATEESVSKLMS